MFIVQPASSFGDLICEELSSQRDDLRHWRAFEFAVAWVNYAGAEEFAEAAQEFLAEGGVIRATVGLDFGSTTYEGLRRLLDLEVGGADVTTHVFCDENPACTFHPKVFLFRNIEQAFLLVGSNNMTGAGLQTNVEAALGFVAALENDAIRAVRGQLAAWRDESDSKIRRLTTELLEQLRDLRYVLTEEELRDRRNSEARFKPSPVQPLFGRSPTRSKRPRRRANGQGEDGERTPETVRGHVLLMRVRPRRNGKQLQISMRVLEASFMKGAKEVVSRDGAYRAIGYNWANGVRNTARFEAPEMTDIQNPVARFRWIDAARGGSKADRVLRYEIFDADNDAEGAKILRSLEEGIASPPVINLEKLSQEWTVLSMSDRSRAQWYRLDSA